MQEHLIKEIETFSTEETLERSGSLPYASVSDLATG